MICLKTYVKLFADDTSLFSVIHYPRVKTETFNEDLNKVSQCTNGKCYLIPILQNKVKKLYLLERTEQRIMEASCLTT